MADGASCFIRPIASVFAVIAVEEASARSISRPRAIGSSYSLAGLEPNQWWPLYDTTNFGEITKIRIALTDSTATCAAPPTGTAPTNVQIRVGQAGVGVDIWSYVNVATAATNTGVGSADQCVFRMTIKPGQNGLPSTLTDIVAANVGGATLDGTQNVSVLLKVVKEVNTSASALQEEEP